MSDLERAIWYQYNHYQVLELPRDASSEEVRASYRLLTQVWNPDNLDKAEWKRLATERRSMLDEAYRCLVHESAREEYDKGLGHQDANYVIPFEDRRQGVPANWKAMAAWMKEHNIGTPFLRKIAFQAGDYIERQRRPSAKQLPYMLQAWTVALESGFLPPEHE